jgi:3'(2'), 5'-bisphosphate nucleotidase
MSEKLLTSRKALMNMVRRIAIEAGNITLRHFDDAGYHGADAKADGSPVTVADREAEAYIEEELKKILPSILMVGEETALKRARPDLSLHDYFWLVDPLDGTMEFISGSGEYTVNIALIHKRRPVMGVIYAPVPGELYAGYINPDGEMGAMIWKEDSGVEKPISVRPPPARGLSVVASKNHGNPKKLEDFLSGYKIDKVVKRGSSLKICAIAAGKADLYARFGLTCEWDTAAGHAILRAAGGDIRKTDGSELNYGGDDPRFLNPEFIASGFDWADISE